MTQAILSHAQQMHQQGDTLGAMNLISDALAKTPQAPDLLYFRAHLAIAANDLDRAAQDLDALIETNPNSAQVLDDRGVIYQMHGDYMRAAECHLRAAELDPNSDHILLNLAIALNSLGQKPQAEALYQDVLKINPQNTRALVNLGILADDAGRHGDALNYFSRSVTAGDTSFELCMAMGNAYRHLEQKEQAFAWYGRAVAQQPGNESAQFMLAMMRGDTPDTAPASHVAGLFDSYADTFEASLQDKLRYSAPDVLFAMIVKPLSELHARYGDLAAMDLGAGTGLFGKKLRPYVAQNIAVDLSPKMLQKAQEQGIYTQLLVGDIVDGLAQAADASLHVVAAADVFVYVGALEKTFALAAQKLAAGGLFVFTAECLLPTETPPYVLRDTGRYAHDRAYIEKLAARNGFMVQEVKQQFLRMNKNDALDGFFAVLIKI